MWGQTKYPFTEEEAQKAKADIRSDIDKMGWDAETKKRVGHLVLVVIEVESSFFLNSASVPIGLSLSRSRRILAGRGI